jgi:hypothetical protein
MAMMMPTRCHVREAKRVIVRVRPTLSNSPPPFCAAFARSLIARSLSTPPRAWIGIIPRELPESRAQMRIPMMAESFVADDAIADTMEACRFMTGKGK